MACSCAPDPWVLWGMFFMMIMSDLCFAISGSIVPSAGKVQLVSVPVGHHFSGTMPSGVNRISRRWGPVGGPAVQRGEQRGDGRADPQRLQQLPPGGVAAGQGRYLQQLHVDLPMRLSPYCTR